MPLIRDIEETKQFVKLSKEKEDYFQEIIEKIISRKNEEE